MGWVGVKAGVTVLLLLGWALFLRAGSVLAGRWRERRGLTLGLGAFRWTLSPGEQRILARRLRQGWPEAYADAAAAAREAAKKDAEKQGKSAGGGAAGAPEPVTSPHYVPDRLPGSELLRSLRAGTRRWFGAAGPLLFLALGVLLLVVHELGSALPERTRLASGFIGLGSLLALAAWGGYRLRRDLTLSEELTGALRGLRDVEVKELIGKLMDRAPELIGPPPAPAPTPATARGEAKAKSPRRPEPAPVADPGQLLDLLVAAAERGPGLPWLEEEIRKLRPGLTR